MSASIETAFTGPASPTFDWRLLVCVLDTVEENVLVTNRQGRIEFANRALANMHGRSREELIGEHFSIVLPADANEPQMEKMRQAWRDSQPVRVVVQGNKRNGAVMWLSIAITPIKDASGRASHFVGISTDITQHVEDARLKRELQERIESQDQERERLTRELRLAQKLEAVGRLAAGVAHEINTPIQFVSDNVAFMRESIGDMTKVVEAYKRGVEHGDAAAEEVDFEYLVDHLPKAMDCAKSGADRVASIVRALKEFAHPGSEERSPADINQAMENALQLACGEYKLFSQIETHLGDLPLLICNIGELNQVFINLLVNAAHAIEASGKDSSTGRIRVTTGSLGAEVCIAIEDNGCGIAPEHLDRIFDPFFTTKEVGKGTGQGLAIARSIIVDRHGGTIEVDSTVGTGTRMTLRLPVT